MTERMASEQHSGVSSVVSIEIWNFHKDQLMFLRWNPRDKITGQHSLKPRSCNHFALRIYLKPIAAACLIMFPFVIFNKSSLNSTIFTRMVFYRCWSYVGFTRQPNQTISIGDGCQSVTFQYWLAVLFYSKYYETLNAWQESATLDFAGVQDAAVRQRRTYDAVL